MPSWHRVYGLCAAGEALGGRGRFRTTLASSSSLDRVAVAASTAAFASAAAFARATATIAAGGVGSEPASGSNI
jgi:hypothetical protein